MSKGTLYDKVWENHAVGKLPTGQTQIYVGRHLIHEVTSPQAFEMVRERQTGVRRPDLSFATLDHIIPTDYFSRPFKDCQAELMAKEIEKNVNEFGITYFGPESGKGGVCHVVFPEQGILWPGQVAVCGDSHTCTYGAMGALAFGIGTTEVSQVLVTQTLAMEPLKVRRVNFNGKLSKAVTAKDMALYMIKELGVKGGINQAYEYGGEAIETLPMEGRLTLCNLSVEGGARSGYVNPDDITFNYLKGKPFAPKNFEEAVPYWKSIASEPNAEYDIVTNLDVSKIEPMVTWGVNPSQAVGVRDRIPSLGLKDGAEAEDALKYIGLEAGNKLHGTPVDVVFIGSCTNGRLSDLKAAAEILGGNRVKVSTLVVPGSQTVKYEAEKIGLDEIFKDSGAEWRNAGCSMCLAMNRDKLKGQQRCASTSNRNFKGRQGSPTGRTHLMSPYTAAATAIEGSIADPRDYL